MAKLNYGITMDLMADIREEDNACNGFTMDVSLGCPHHCVYCIFSQLEQKVYKLQNPKYNGSTIPMCLDKFMQRTDFPPVVYMCYSSDPFGNEEINRVSSAAIRKLVENNVHVFISTKGRLSDEAIETLKIRPELIHFQMGIASHDDARNKIVEPGAPCFEERLEWLHRVEEIKNIGDITVRMDPLLPGIDDNEDNIRKVLSKIGSVENVVIGYVIMTSNMRNTWSKVDFLAKSASLLTERVNTVSGNELYSIPFDDKVEKLTRFREICKEYGKIMRTCGCKDERLKQTNLDWICHPFTKKVREELISNSTYKVRENHFGNYD